MALILNVGTHLAIASAEKWLARANRWLPWLATLLLLAVLAAVLAQLTWRLIPVPDAAVFQPIAPPTIVKNNTSRPQVGTSQRGPNPAALARLHLFGEADVKAVVQAPTQKQEIRQTNLKLTLTGTIAREDPKTGIALISAEREKEKPFLVGEEVSGSTKLHEVYADRVVLDRNGNLETLALARKEGSGNSSSSSSSTRNSSRSSTSSRSLPTFGGTAARSASSSSKAGDKLTAAGNPDYRSIREELINDPNKVTDYIRVQPVQKDGAISGYRIYPGRNRDLFRKAGLRSGDLIKTVNGQSVQDPNQGISIITALTTAERIDLTIERRGRPKQLSVNLNE